MKDSQQTIKQKLLGKKSKYLVASILFPFFSILFTWFIQFQSHISIMHGKGLLILGVLLIVAWFPFVISLFLMFSLKIPLDIFLLVPKFNKKIFWALLVPCLIAALAIDLGQYLFSISFEEQELSKSMADDHFASALLLLFINWFPAVLFCIVIATGIEISLRAFFIEVCRRAFIPVPWFFAGTLQFILLLPFLWFGYLGGGPQNLKYILCWYILQISLSAFFFWLSLPVEKEFKGGINKMHLNSANRSLIPVLLAASLQNIVYYVIASRFVIESGNWWMSGPANVIAVVLYLMITIFLLTTKRLKY